MKIALDARWIFKETSGIGQHTRLLIESLTRLDPPHEFVLIFDDADMASDVKTQTRCPWPHLTVPYGLFSLKNQYALLRLLKREKVDIYHSTNYMMPLPGFPCNRAGNVKAVITIHDLIPMVYRDHAPRSMKSRLYPVYAGLMRQVAARADRIITVSNASARDLRSRLGLKGGQVDKISVVYNGLDPQFLQPHTVPRHDPPEILYVGRLDPYKNLLQVVQAFSEVRRSLPKGTRLRVIGPPDGRYPEALNLARTHDLMPQMDWEGHVTFSALLEAYRRASLLVLASEYEGFGLPVAEAMACGTPVICSNASSLPEVGGDAARYVPPGDSQALGECMKQVLNQPDLQQDMRMKGLIQAQKFQGSTMAEQTLGVYEDLMRE